MLRRIFASLLLCTLAGIPAHAAGADPAAADPMAAEPQFQKHCTTCHPADRALKKNKDREGWQKTVKRMQGYASGLLGDDDAASIVEYLTHVSGPNN